MTRDELRHEMAEGVGFWGLEQDGELSGVMGTQAVKDVTLIRHAYADRPAEKRDWGETADAFAELDQYARIDWNVGRRDLGYPFL